jgi:hypothetical protein
MKPEQRVWGSMLSAIGWQVAVCRGAGEAIKQLEAWGY